MEIKKKRKTRMYEPWGYQDENNYQSAEIIYENDLNSFFADTSYNRDDNKIHFMNKDGEEVATLDVSEFIKSDTIIDHTEYSDGILKITFTNGDVITIDLTELLDENEFKDGLIVEGHEVKVKIDEESEAWLTVSENGLKISGINAEIERLDGKIDDEEARAKGEEERIDAKLDQEIEDRIADVDEEQARAEAAEQVLTTNLNNEITRATQTEQVIVSRVDTLNDELDAEESARAAEDARIRLAIEQETARATNAENELNDLINEVSGETSEAVNDLVEKLGYKDNDTLMTTNPHEVAFGEYNISNTSAYASGQTIFSIGNGTSNGNRSNALEVRKDGTLYLWVEGQFMNVNDLLSQIAHETY